MTAKAWELEEGSVTRPGSLPVAVRVFQEDDGEAIVSLEVAGCGIGFTPATARKLAEQLVIQAGRVEALWVSDCTTNTPR